MSMNELENKVAQLRELQQMQAELAAEVEAVQDDLKGYMTSHNTDELHGPSFKITWKIVTSARLDTAALKSVLPDVAARFSKTTSTRRFVLA